MKQLGCRALTEHELKEKRHEMDAIKGAYHTLGDDSLPLGGRICTCRTNRCRPDVMNFRLPLQQADLPKHLTVTDNSYFSMTLHRYFSIDNSAAVNYCYLDCGMLVKQIIYRRHCEVDDK